MLLILLQCIPGDTEKIDKQDITLYIDLSKESNSGKYDIDYASNYDIKSIQINPNTTEQ